VFGPVVTVQRFTDEEQALRWANGVKYGKDLSMYGFEDYTRIKRIMSYIGG
jgi:betaine-aldehyde dehydrogenase